MLVLSFISHVVTGESLCLCVPISLPLKEGYGCPEDSSLKALRHQKASRPYEMPTPSQERWLFICLDSWCFLCYWHCQWASKCFTASCLPRDGTYFMTDALCRVGFSPVSVLRLVCHLGFWVSSTTICPPPCKTAAPSALSILLLPIDIPSPKEACSKNAAGQMVWQFQWFENFLHCVFAIIDNGVPGEYMALARLWSIFPCLSGVICVLMKSLSMLCMQRLALCWLRGPAQGPLCGDAATEQSTGVGQTLGNFKCFFLTTGLFFHIFQILNWYL